MKNKPLTGYDKYMNQIWKTKERVYKETKNLKGKKLWDYFSNARIEYEKEKQNR